MEKDQTSWKPMDLHVSIIGVLQDESLKKMKAANPNLLSELNPTIL